MAPSEAHKMVLALRMEAGADAFYDWQGGLVWLRMEDEPAAETLRNLVRQFGGGHATLMRASPAWRAAVPVFEPQPAALAALSARLKAEFDPKNILNPGRMAGGDNSATLAPATEGEA
jgi:glycolate oxidase FAD binding subunit